MPAQRRRFTNGEKRYILNQANELGVTKILREYKLSYSVFARWKQQFLTNESENPIIISSSPPIISHNALKPDGDERSNVLKTNDGQKLRKRTRRKKKTKTVDISDEDEKPQSASAQDKRPSVGSDSRKSSFKRKLGDIIDTDMQQDVLWDQQRPPQFKRHKSDHDGPVLAS